MNDYIILIGNAKSLLSKASSQINNSIILDRDLKSKRSKLEYYERLLILTDNNLVKYLNFRDQIAEKEKQYDELVKSISTKINSALLISLEIMLKSFEDDSRDLSSVKIDSKSIFYNCIRYAELMNGKINFDVVLPTLIRLEIKISSVNSTYARNIQIRVKNLKKFLY